MISGGFQLGNRKVAGADFGLDWPGLRCGAHARTTGQPCKAPAVTGKQRCRMHGGAKGSGGPRGEANGNYRAGQFTKEMLAGRKIWRASARILEQYRREGEREEKKAAREFTVILGSDRAWRQG
jgi:hypothetical protein